MTISVKVSRDAKDVPQSMQIVEETQIGSGKDAFWRASEVQTMLPGEERTFVLWPGKRVVLCE